MNDIKKPLIVSIKENSLDDGPGIRSVIFFKGCPLSCVWCQNPETKQKTKEIQYQEDKCIFCKSCKIICLNDAFIFDEKPIFDFKLCNLCYECIDQCPSGVFLKVGEYIEIETLLEKINENVPFYRNSGGGITLSGGEPLLFSEYVSKLVDNLFDKEISIVLETCGFFNIDTTIVNILKKTDIIYYDIKIMDNIDFNLYCKADNTRILNNFRELIANNLVQLPSDINALDFKIKRPDKPLLIPRIPLIPNITTKESNLKSIDEFFKENHIKIIALLEYNPLWSKKSEQVGRIVEYKNNLWMKKEDINQIKQIFCDYEII